MIKWDRKPNYAGAVHHEARLWVIQIGGMWWVEVGTMIDKKQADNFIRIQRNFPDRESAIRYLEEAFS